MSNSDTTSRPPEPEIWFKVGNESVRLEPDDVRHAVRTARREGRYVGAMTGVTLGYGAWRYFRISRNMSFLTGVVTFMFSSYAFGALSFANRVHGLIEERRKAQSSELIPDELLRDSAEQWKSS